MTLISNFIIFIMLIMCAGRCNYNEPFISNTDVIIIILLILLYSLLCSVHNYLRCNKVPLYMRLSLLFWSADSLILLAPFMCCLEAGS